MSSLVCSIVSYVVNATWEIPFIAATGWAVSRIQKRLGPQAQHVTWVVTLCMAVLTPALPLYRTILDFLFLPNAIAGRTSIAIATLQSSGANARGMAILPSAVIVVLFSCYLCALLYFAARLLWSIYWTATLVRDSCPLSLGPERNELWSRCKREFSLRDVSILSSRRVSGPVTIGFRRPALLLPVEFPERCTPHEFLTAIGHESAHMKRRDFQKNLFYEAMSLIIAFHPLTWFLKAQIAQTREMICDAMAIEKLIDSRDYSQSLLQLAIMIFHVPPVSTTQAIGIFDANILEKRIMYITTKKQRLTWIMRCGLIIPGALLLCSVAAGGAVAAIGIEPQAQSSSQAKPDDQAYHVGGDVSAPRIILAPDPVFPKSADKGKGKFEGVCVLKTVVNTSGMPTNIQVVRSLSPDFDASAIKAVQQYRFNPGMRFGTPVPVSVNIEVNFKKY
jgi:TonB family protein